MIPVTDGGITYHLPELAAFLFVHGQVDYQDVATVKSELTLRNCSAMGFDTSATTELHTYALLVPQVKNEFLSYIIHFLLTFAVVRLRGPT